MGYLTSGLVKKDFSKNGKWRLFQKYLANIELIPYHSEGIILPSYFSESQFEYLAERYMTSLEFIKNCNPNLFIFNGSVWHNLLIKHKLIHVYQRVEITQKFSLFFFDLYDIPCVLFDKFFQRHFWGISNHDRQVRIPAEVHKIFPKILNGLSKL